MKTLMEAIKDLRDLLEEENQVMFTANLSRELFSPGYLKRSITTVGDME